jgi:hypothetical protein
MIASLGPKYPSTVPIPPAVKSTFDCIAWHNLAGVFFIVHGILDSILMSSSSSTHFYMWSFTLSPEDGRIGRLADFPLQGLAAQAIRTITAL